MEWLAQEAATHVVAQDAVRPRAQRHLLTLVEPSLSPSPDALHRQLRSLHTAILGEWVGPWSAEVARTAALYRSLEADLGPESAWIAVIAAMLQDHRLVLP